MPIYQTIQDMLKTQAQTDLIGSEANKNIQQILMQKRGMEQQDYIRSQLSQMNAGQPPEAQPQTQDAGDDPLQKEMTQIQQLRNRALGEAKIYQGGPFPNLAEADKALQRADTLTTQARETAQKQLEQQAKQSQQLAQSFGGITDQETFQNVVANAVRQGARNPQVAKMLQPLLTGVDFSPDTGMPLYNDRAKNAIKVMGAAQTSFDQQAQLASTANLRAIEQARQVERERHDKAMEVAANTRAAAAQAGATAARTARADIHQDTVEGRALSQAQTISSSYKSDKEVAQFAENAAAYKAAKTYLFTQDDAGNVVMKPNAAFDSPGDSSLVDYYFKVAHPGRGLRSVSELKGVDKMAGVPARILEGIQNIFFGKEIPLTVKAEMFKSMDNKFQQDNAQQIEREDSHLNRVRNLKNLPSTARAEDYVPQYAIRPEGTASAKATTGTTQPKDGDVAVNKSTGERLVWVNGQWQKMQ